MWLDEDINPIENIFHLIKCHLREEVINRNIVSESFEQYEERVLQGFRTMLIDVIDRTIESMPKQIEMMVKTKGYRTKY